MKEKIYKLLILNTKNNSWNNKDTMKTIINRNYSAENQISLSGIQDETKSAWSARS